MADTSLPHRVVVDLSEKDWRRLLKIQKEKELLTVSEAVRFSIRTTEWHLLELVDEGND